MAKKTVMKAERAWFLDHKGEESEAGVRVRFPRWGNLMCFRAIYLFLIKKKKMVTIFTLWASQSNLIVLADT